MKAFLITGIVLMTGASIYGFIDYKNSSRNKELTRLYRTEEPSAVAVAKQPTVEIKKDAVKETPEMKGGDKVVKKKTSEPVESSVKKTEGRTAGKMTINPVESVKTETVGNTVVIAKPSSIKKKKKLNYKLFSRAALDERYIDRELKLEKQKKDKQ
jgi:hypothetical protein